MSDRDHAAPTPPAHPPGSWAPVRRAAVALASPIQRILAVEAASGIVLLAVSAIALTWANLWPASYEGLWHTPIGLRVGPWAVEHSLHYWVNEGLMTVFFFVVGLEIRREIYEGELARWRSAALPLAAALGGMLVPAVIYAALNLGREGASGWAVPMATDIAFAVGVLTLLGSRVPAAFRVLLLALAVIDDLGAIVVIAVFYGQGVSLEGAGLALLGVAMVIAMRSAGVRAPLLYVVPGIVVWSGFVAMGIHPTIAGVVLGMLTPVRSWLGMPWFEHTTRSQLDELAAGDRDAVLSGLDQIDVARREVVSPVDRLIHALHPWVAFVVMPVFALANAGVELSGAHFGGDSLYVFVGIIAGLAIGKPLGIVGLALAARRLGVAPSTLRRRGILLVGVVGGIGFTMSLFMAQLAFPPGAMLDTAKLAILIGSGIAIVLGLALGVAVMRAPAPGAASSRSEP